MEINNLIASIWAPSDKGCESLVDVDWIATFVTVTEAGSFRAAARRLYVSQAAVSQQIGRLERELSTPLFDRRGRGVELNAAGLRFLADAQKLLALWRRSQAAVLRETARERLELGTDWLTAETLAPWLCRQLLLHRPHADLVVKLWAAADEHWDVALLAEAGEAGGVYGSPLFSDAIVFVAAAEGGDLDQPPPDPDVWLGERRVLVPGQSRYWPLVEERLTARGVGIQTVEINHPSVIKRLVAEGVGSSFLPELLVRREVMEGRLVALTPPWLDGVRVRTSVMRRETAARESGESLADLALRLLSRRFPPDGSGAQD